VSTDKLKTSTLFASVWHHDMFGHNKFLGEAKIPLDLSELENPPLLPKPFVLVNHDFSVNYTNY
jgi:hypothetical protein